MLVRPRPYVTFVYRDAHPTFRRLELQRVHAQHRVYPQQRDPCALVFVHSGDAHPLPLNLASYVPWPMTLSLPYPLPALSPCP